MNDEKNEQLTPVDGDADIEVVEEAQAEPVELPAEFAAAGSIRAVKWDSGGRPGKWTTIGCGAGLILLVAALFAGSGLLKKTVWAGFGATSRNLVANLPGNLPPGERMRLTRNLDRFAVHVQQEEDPYEIMGEFQQLARAVMEDRKITSDEVEELNLFLEVQLPDSRHDLPYSMP